MNTQLKYYYEDIDSIFEQCKEKFNYNNFAMTSKNKFDGLLLKCNDVSKKLIEEVWENTEEAVDRLLEIQTKLEQIIFQLKISDEIYKSGVYGLAKGIETDSTRPSDFNNSDWKTIITAN